MPGLWWRLSWCFVVCMLGTTVSPAKGRTDRDAVWGVESTYRAQETVHFLGGRGSHENGHCCGVILFWACTELYAADILNLIRCGAAAIRSLATSTLATCVFSAALEVIATVHEIPKRRQHRQLLRQQHQRCEYLASRAVCHYAYPLCAVTHRGAVPTPRRLCRSDCQALETDVCRTLYDLARTHPAISKWTGQGCSQAGQWTHSIREITVLSIICKALFARLTFGSEKKLA